MSRLRLLSIVLALVSVNSLSPAALKLASVFSDHMVIQRERPIRVWGTADANATVDVQLGEDRATAKADGAGKWLATLKPAQAGGPVELRISSGQQRLAVSDVLIGDVFLCSGQSNMQMTLKEADGGADAAKSAPKLGDVRLLMVPKGFAETPNDAFDAKWTACTPEAAANFSAVAVFFAASLRENPTLTNVPIGLIDSSFGGTCAEGWISRQTLDASYKAEDLRDSMFGLKPSHLYNAMIAPLAPMSLKGVLWYQGESNAPRADLYERLLTTLIGEWRGKFGDDKLPFFIVQLPNFPGLMDGMSFVWLREAQAKVAAHVPHTYMAVTIDTPDGVDLHPRSKRMVGQRLGVLARAHLYGEKVVSAGPAVKSATAEGSAMRVEFETRGSALKARNGASPSGFMLAGDDGVYRNAEARIERDSVILRSEEVPSPRTVRYAWSAFPRAELYNDAGLPAGPFRTDNAPIQTLIEAIPTPAPRKVATAGYTLTIDGDSTLSSVLVGGQQMLSNDSPGFMLVGWFGTPRQMYGVREISPDCVEFTDNSLVVRYECAVRGLVIRINNKSGEAVPARLLMSAGVTSLDAATTQPVDGVVKLRRGKSELMVTGIARMSRTADGTLELITEVPKGEQRTLELQTRQGG